MHESTRRTQNTLSIDVSTDQSTAARRCLTPMKKKQRAPTMINEHVATSVLKNHDFGFTESALMQGIPNEVQDEVRRYAAVKLSFLWVPRVMLRSSKNKRRKDKNHLNTEFSSIVQLLRTGELLSCWPMESLHHLAEEALPVTTQTGDVIIHEGESGGTGLWLILSGRVTITKKEKIPNNKGLHHVAVIARISAPKLIGDFALLTDEPRTASVVLEQDCDCWTIPRSLFVKELNLLPQNHKDSIYNKAFQRRERNIITFLPRTAADLKASFLFADLTDHEAGMLVEILQPLCIRSENAIYEAGDIGKGVYYLCRGRAEGVTPTGEVTVHTPTSNSTFGEITFVFGCGKQADSVRAVQHCDMWLLPFVKLLELLKYENIRKCIYNRSSEARMKYLEEQRTSPVRIETAVEMLSRSHIIGELCSRSFLTDVATRLKPLVFLPNQNILSAVNECNRLYILVSGKACVQNNLTKKHLYFKSGDVIGVSCLAFHRWLFPVQSVAGCDMWYLEKSEFVSCLEAHDHYSSVMSAVRRSLVEHEYFPLSVMLDRRYSKNGYLIPPVLHPFPGLPQGISVPFHFEDRKVTPCSPAAVHPAGTSQGAKKCWIITNNTVAQAKPAEWMEYTPTPPPKKQASINTSCDLTEALKDIKNPPRFNRMKRRRRQK